MTESVSAFLGRVQDPRFCTSTTTVGGLGKIEKNCYNACSVAVVCCIAVKTFETFTLIMREKNWKF